MTPREKLKAELDGSCWKFAQYMLPHFAFSECHREIFLAMSDEEGRQDTANLLVLIPRDHLKSVMLAVYTAWRISRKPSYTVLYITADEDLGKLQMSFIKNIFESDRYRALYPDHFIPDAGRREKWTTMALNVDHPDRKALNIRDESIVVKTVKAGKTGRHPDEIMFDDLVVPENAYTEVGRAEVRRGAAQAASLLKGSCFATAVGTRYHPADQYALWSEAEQDLYDDDGVWTGKAPLWKVIEKRVEDLGDGTGNFLWPRTYSPVTKEWYGWDIKSLARKRAEYFANGERTQFMAQYYMEPNDPSEHRISADQFQYWTPRLLEYIDGAWYYSKRKLNIVATMDTAITDAASASARRADFTAIAVVAMCEEGFYYVLDVVQFQTDKRSVYYKEVIGLYNKWRFRYLHIEEEQAGKIIADAMRERVREDGYSLVIKGEPAKRGISKHERHASILLPRYEQAIVFHNRGGWQHEMEEQICKPRPAHDDILDALTIAFDKLQKPQSRHNYRGVTPGGNLIIASGRFGGRRG